MTDQDDDLPAPEDRQLMEDQTAPQPDTDDDDDAPAGERIAKVMARAGVASRRDAERMIVEGRVQVNGRVIRSPALDIGPGDRVLIDGQPMEAPQPTRLWLYYKPVGLVTSEADEKGRQTVFDALPRDLPRVMTVGRLDLNSEGLLLLTNDGALKRRLELPETAWMRRYRVRVNGQPNQLTFEPLRRGAVIDGEQFQPMEIELDSQQGANAWLTVGIREGRNREIRRAMAHVGLMVNRLIRVGYGPFRLAGLEKNEVREVKRRVLRDQLGGLLAEDGADAPAARPQRSPDRRLGPGAARGDKPRWAADKPGARPPRPGVDRKPRWGGEADRPWKRGEGPRRDDQRPGDEGRKPHWGGERDRPWKRDGAEAASGEARKPRWGADRLRGGEDRPQGDAGRKPRWGAGERSGRAGEGRPWTGERPPRPASDKPRGPGAKPGFGKDRRAADGKPRAWGDAQRSDSAQGQGGKPRPWSGERTEGARDHGAKPRFGQGGAREDRPRFGQGQGGGREDNPRFGQGGAREDKPRFGPGGTREDKPRFGQGGAREDKPRWGERKGFGDKPRGPGPQGNRGPRASVEGAGLPRSPRPATAERLPKGPSKPWTAGGKPGPRGGANGPRPFGGKPSPKGPGGAGKPPRNGGGPHD